MNNELLRKIPSLDSLLREQAVQQLIEEHGRDVVAVEGRAELDAARTAIAAAGGAAVHPEVFDKLRFRSDRK